MKKYIFLILTVGLLIRLAGINQSVWLDEAISLNVVNDNYTEFAKNDFHPPLYYLTLGTWIKATGNSVESARLLSVIFALVTVWVVYKIGGIWPAALVSFNPLLVYYSQEVRMYSMVTMLVTIAFYFFIKKRYLWTSLFLGLGFLTFYGSVFLIAGITIYLLVNKKYKEIFLINIFPVIFFGLNWPLMQEQLKNSNEMLAQVANWDLVLGKVNIKNLLLIPMKFTSGRISFEPKIVYYLISGIWALMVLANLFKRNIYTLIFWLTLGVGTIFSIFTPMLQYFRFLYLVPIMCLGIGKSKIIVGGFLIFSLVYVLNPSFHREDWKSLAMELPNKVYMINSFGDPIKYYRPEVEISDFRATINESEIAVIPYGEEIHGFDHQKLLTEAGYLKRIEKSYRQLSIEKWIKVVK